MATQMGKTSGVIFNTIGVRAHFNPVPQIYLGPTRSQIDNVVEPKIMELIDQCAELSKRTLRGKLISKHHKRINGVALRLAWAGSATETSSDTAAIVYVDEIDRMPRSIGTEGSPVELAEARTGTYADGRIFVTATPTNGVAEARPHPQTGLYHWQDAEPCASPVWRFWEEGTRHEWAIPCPHERCREYFIPKSQFLQWDDSGTIRTVFETAVLVCPNCGAEIEDQCRDPMNANGMYVAPGQQPLPYQTGDDGVYMAEHPALPEDWEDSQPLPEGPELERGAPGVTHVPFGEYLMPPGAHGYVTFWVSGLCSFSAKKTYGFLANKLHRARKSQEPERMQGVMNTDYGELYSITGEAPQWEEVQLCRRAFSLEEIAKEIHLITVGADPSADRIWYVARAWFRDGTSFLLKHGDLVGNIDLDVVWGHVLDLLDEDFGGHMPALCLVDSGFRKDPVYSFGRENRRLVKCSKGHDSLDKPFYMNRIDIDIRGKTIKRGLELWHIDSDVAKSFVHVSVEKTVQNPDEPGGWFLPMDIDKDYCKQIVAEERMLEGDRVSWNVKSRRNHFLDCEALAYMAMRIHGLRGRRKRRSRTNIDSQPEHTPQRQESPAQPTGYRRRGI